MMDVKNSCSFQAKKRYAIKIAVILPTISAINPHITAYLEFFIPTDPK